MEYLNQEVVMVKVRFRDKPRLNSRKSIENELQQQK